MSIDRNHMNLLVTIDSNYIGPLSVMLKSYTETNNDVTTDVYIAHSSLCKEFRYPGIGTTAGRIFLSLTGILFLAGKCRPLPVFGSGYYYKEAWGAVPGMIYCVLGNMIGTLIIFGLTKKYGKRIQGIIH